MEGSLKESFLRELEELSDEGEESHEGSESLEEPQPRHSEDQNDNSLLGFEQSQKYEEFIKKLRDSSGGALDSPESLSIIKDCQEYSGLQQREISILHKKLQDIYERHFPELEQMVSDPILYSRCILLIRNGLNPNQVALDFLPHGLEMQIKMALSITKGEPLSETELKELEKGARLVAQRQEEHELILKYLESAMAAVAPNLSAVVGSKVAARLVVTAGGVKALSQIPACNIQVMGGPRKSAGNSHWSSGAEIQSKHLGIFGEMDIVKFSSTKDKKKMVRILASNSANAARVDAAGTRPSGDYGRDLLRKMQERIEKINAPTEMTERKPLPVPENKPKQHRGGKRYRKMKEKNGLSEMAKMRNRVRFGTDAEEEYRDSMKGFGMLSQVSSGAGRIRLSARVKKMSLSRPFSNSYISSQGPAKKQGNQLRQSDERFNLQPGLCSDAGNPPGES